MNFLKVLAPTFWCNRLFGLSSYIVNSNGVRHSRFLQMHRYLFCVTSLILQLGWFAQHLYFKYSTKAMKQFQEIILLFCVACNIMVSLLPCRSLFSDDGSFHHLMIKIHKYERELFLIKNRKLRKLFLLNVALIISGFMVPIAFMSLEALKTWTSYSIGKHHILTDITGLSSGFLRPCIDVVLLDNYFMYILVYGTTYASINESLSSCAVYSNSNRKIDRNFFLKYLKNLEDLDNVLKDFHTEIMIRQSSFCIIIVILALSNWFYVVGFIFLNLSPLFMTYYAWVTFFTVIFSFVICVSVYAMQQVERTPGLLNQLYSEGDDPRIIDEIEIFSLQLLHRKLEFEAGGFLKLDFSLLLSMVGTVTTYVLILVQFEDPGVARKFHLNQTNLMLSHNNTGY